MNNVTNLSKLAISVRMEAKPEKAAELEALLRDALALAEQEHETVAWFSVKFGENSFGVFDTFVNESGRQMHFDGKIAEALLSRAEELLTQAPIIETAEVLAAKHPA